MKCEICGCETNYSGPRMDLYTGMVSDSAAVGLVVSTNSPSPKESFHAVFGFWDQRSQKSFEICGACIADGLRKISQIVFPSADIMAFNLDETVGSLLADGSFAKSSGDGIHVTAGVGIDQDEPPNPVVVVPK